MPPLSREKRWVVENVIKRETRTADTDVDAIASADVHLVTTRRERDAGGE